VKELLCTDMASQIAAEMVSSPASLYITLDYRMQEKCHMQ